MLASAMQFPSMNGAAHFRERSLRQKEVAVAAQARTLRLADGPDDVHLASIATAELKGIRAKL